MQNAELTSVPLTNPDSIMQAAPFNHNLKQVPSVPFYKVNEVADLLRVHRMTVYNMIHAGDIKIVRIGRTIRIPADQFASRIIAIRPDAKTL